MTPDSSSSPVQIDAASAQAGAASAPKAKLRVRRDSSPVLAAGVMFGVVILLVVAACLVWTTATYQGAIARSNEERLRIVSRLLADNVENLLASEDPQQINTLLTEATLRYELTTCLVKTGDGTVIAEGKPHAVASTTSPAKQPWPALSDAMRSEGERVENGAYTGSLVLNVPGKGESLLVVSGRVAAPVLATSELQTGLLVVGGVALCGMLLAWRSLQRRFRSFTAIRSLVLRAAAEPDARAEALTLSTQGGAVAHAWNELMSTRDGLRERAVLRETIEQLGTGSRSDVGGHSAVDALWMGVLLLGADGKIRYANGAAAVMLSVRRDQLAGVALGEVIPDVSLLAAVGEVASGRSRQRASVELERAGAGPDAERSVLRVTVKGLRKEDSAAALVMIEDVTQQRVADESRNAFVAQATHELRTPLTNMRLYIETLVEDDGTDPAVRAKCLNVISGESRRLERIVGDMLSVSEIEAGSLKINEDDVRLDALFTDLDGDFRAQAEDREMTLAFELPPKLPVIKGDRDKLMLAFHNVLGNAIKYTPPGGTVRVVVRTEGPAITVDIADNGIGIKPDECEKIFERFYRAKDKRIGSITGSGLGLALARQIARLHGGDITVRSEIDKGSTFSLSLPSGGVLAAVGGGNEQRKAA